MTQTRKGFGTIIEIDSGIQVRIALDASKQSNHSAPQVDAHNHQYFQSWRLFAEIGEQSWE
jgi:hypothetical protein